ncbi:BatA and WFA domain-containing protein [candidate division KSB1 bacterium]
MTFLNTIILSGLFAALIPLLIHLFSRRKKKIIPFSSLYFLRLLENKKIRRLKIKQIILLLLRMMIVALLVLAFARPTVTGNFGSGYSEDSRISAVIIVDNSLSTSAENEGNNTFSLIRNKSLELLENFRDGDELFLLFTSDNIENRIEPEYDPGIHLEKIKKSGYTYKPALIVPFLKKAVSLLNSSNNYYKEVFFISDMQKTGLAEDEVRELNFNGTENVKLYMIDAVSNDPVNTAVKNVKIINQIIEQGSNINIRAEIGNFSDENVSEILVNLYLNGQRMAQRDLSLNESGTKTIDFQIVPGMTGLIEGFVEIEDDALSADNTRYFMINVPEKISVLLVEDENNEGFLQTMLEPETSEQFELDLINPGQVFSMEFGDYDAVIYNGFTSFTQSDVYRLRNYLNNGGGVVLFPGEQSDLVAYEQTIGEAFDLPVAAGFMGSLNPEFSSQANFFSVDNIDQDHALFTGMFKDISPELNLPKAYMFVDLVPKVTQTYRNIISFQNNKPFLCEVLAGQGAVFLFACAPSLAWTDFPVKGLFAPLMYRIINYIASSGIINGTDILIGDEISFLYGGNAEDLLMVSPSGDEYRLNTEIDSDAFRIKFKETGLPGIYDFKTGGVSNRKFAVNLDTKESDLRKIPESILDDIMGENTYYLWEYDVNIAQNLKEVRTGREIGKYFIIAVLIFLLLETIIQHEKSEPLKEDKSQKT